MTTTEPLASIAERLRNARAHGTAIAQISRTETELSLEEAYDIQALYVEGLVRSGDPVTGVKLGLTSRAKAEQMGVKDVIIGALTASMEVADGGEVDIATRVHARIEPEVAFRIAADVDPSAPPTNPRDLVDAVAPAMEIIDSRYENFSFALVDVVADNTSASGYVVGPWTAVADLQADLADLPVSLSVDGAVAADGSTSAILGDPWRALEETLRMAARYGQALPAGGVLLAGSATAAVTMQPGTTLRTDIQGLGSTSVRVLGGAEEQA